MRKCNAIGSCWSEMYRNCFLVGKRVRKKLNLRIAFVLAKTAAGAHPKSVGKECSGIMYLGKI